MMVWRNKYSKVGRPKKMFKKSAERQHYSIGGIPMKIVNGRIEYAWNPSHVPFEPKVSPYSPEESFIRKHIYEVRFDIEEEGETDDERRRREYKEWWENQKV